MKKVKIMTLFFIMLFIMLILLYSWLPCENSFERLKVEVNISIFMVFCCIYYEVRMLKKLNLYIIYIILVYLIHAGQCLAIIFGEPINNFPSFIYGGYEYDSIIYALRFTTLAIFSLCIGGNIKNKEKRVINKNININSMYLVGLLLCFISIPFDLYLKANSAIRSIQYGYLSGFQNAYEFKETGSIIGSLSLFCLPGCFLLAYAMHKKNSQLKYLPMMYLIIRSIIDLLCGSRGNAIAILIAVIYFIKNYFFTKENKQSNKINIKKIFFVILGGYFLSCIFMAVFNWRIMENRTIGTLFEEVLRNMLEGGIFRGIFKSLSVEYPLYEVIKNIKTGNYSLKYGMTFIYPIIMIIPSFLRGNLYTIGHEHGWIAIENDLTNSINLGYGIGYTNLAEVYLNFGIYGLIIIIFYGYLISRLVLFNNRDKSEVKEPMKVAMFAILVLTIRSTMQLFYKYCFYYYLIPLLLIYIFNQTLFKNNLEK